MGYIGVCRGNIGDIGDEKDNGQENENYYLGFREGVTEAEPCEGLAVENCICWILWFKVSGPRFYNSWA